MANQPQPLTEKRFRELFLETFNEAFEAVILPHFKAIDKRFDQLEARMDSLEARMDRVEKELLDLSDFAIPRINELQDNVKFIAKKVNNLEKGSGNERTAQELRGLERLISRLKKELQKTNLRVENFEAKLKKLRETSRKKTV